MVNNQITVKAIIKQPVEKVWFFWNDSNHIKQWCHASADWYVPAAENNFKVGGKFKTTMSSRDGKSKFDFEGKYDKIINNKRIEYTMADGRRVIVEFVSNVKETTVIETFDPESVNSHELQRSGWQSILDNFKKHCESYK